jgi:hypothetical protein
MISAKNIGVVLANNSNRIQIKNGIFEDDTKFPLEITVAFKGYP